MKTGDLIQMKSGQFATIIRDPYTYRFMDAEDHMMVEHGMGHMAGSYGSAIDVIFMNTGKKQRLSLSNRNFKVIDD